ncbi:MAG: hypothetical protein ACE5EV_01255 [Gaiellales bacterium]
MGLRDILFGRKRLPKANIDHLFAIPGAGVTLETEHYLHPAGVAAVVFRPLSASQFEIAEEELHDLLQAIGADAGTEIERTTDEYGYVWLSMKDSQLEDLVGAVHVVATELEAKGFGEQLLGATFAFKDDRRDELVQLIYGFKTGTFWPFVPTGEGQRRDNPEELRLKSTLEADLPIEPDLSRWLGLFGAPLDA